MKRYIILALVFLNFISYTITETPQEKVIELSTDSFYKQVSDGRPWLIEFYAPWCGHCKRLAPIYSSVASELNGKVNVAKVDATKERGLTSLFGVSSYPTIFLVINNKVKRFSGSRDFQNLVGFALKDHENVPDVGIFNSPFGPIGRLKWIVIRGAFLSSTLQNLLVEEYGLQPLTATLSLLAGFVFLICFSILVIGLLIQSREDRKTGEYHPHAE